MKTIAVTTQTELNALPERFDEYTVIEIRSTERISIEKSWDNSSVVAWGNSSVEAWDNSSVVARGNSSVEAWGNSSVEAWDNSSVVAWGNSSVEARGNSSVVAWDNSSVVAWGNSSVEARGNSSVVARDNSSVVAWGNSSVEAWGNSSVEAWGNSSVEAWDNSSVEARDNCGVHAFSPYCSIELFGFAVAWLLTKVSKLKVSSTTAHVITPQVPEGMSELDAWLEAEGVKPADGKVILFKRVSKDLQTQEGTVNETTWAIGSTLEHPRWSPSGRECGPGKFHACPRTYFCNEFRSEKRDDRYIAIEVAVADLYVWPAADRQYPHKVAFRKGTVLHECNRLGRKLEVEAQS